LNCVVITNIILAAYEANILSIKNAIASPVGDQNDLENYDELDISRVKYCKQAITSDCPLSLSLVGEAESCV
jgi:hypothetical protein